MRFNSTIIALVVFVLGFGTNALAAGPDYCPADVVTDDVVNVQDLVEVITAWGPCAGSCQADVNSDGQVNVGDLVAVITGWGDCTICEDLGICQPAFFGSCAEGERAPAYDASCDAGSFCCAYIQNDCTAAGGTCSPGLFGCTGALDEDPSLTPACGALDICCVP